MKINKRNHTHPDFSISRHHQDKLTDSTTNPKSRYIDIYSSSDGQSHAINASGFFDATTLPVYPEVQNRGLGQWLPSGILLFSGNFQGVDFQNETASVTIFLENTSDNFISIKEIDLLGATIFQDNILPPQIDLPPHTSTSLKLSFIPDQTFVLSGCFIANIVQNLHLVYHVRSANNRAKAKIDETRPIGYLEYTGSDIISREDYVNLAFFERNFANGIDVKTILPQRFYDSAGYYIDPENINVQIVADMCSKTNKTQLDKLAGMFRLYLTHFDLSYQQPSKTTEIRSSENTWFLYPAIPYDLQAPTETLLFGGDCEDLSILYTSTALAMGIEARLIFFPGHALMIFALDDPSQQLPESLAIDYTEDTDPPGRTWFAFEATGDREHLFKDYIASGKYLYDRIKTAEGIVIIPPSDKSKTYHSPFSHTQVVVLDTN